MFSLLPSAIRPMLTAGTLICLAGCETIQPAPAPPDFGTALNAHLATITGRDLDGFAATLTETPDLDLIFPNGTLVDTTEDVIAFHTEWFGDDQWQMRPVIQKIIEGRDLSMGLIKYEYRDTAESPPRFAWLMLVFQRENGEWRLVHDQNTRIEEPAAD